MKDVIGILMVSTRIFSFWMADPRSISIGGLTVPMQRYGYLKENQISPFSIGFFP
jgi:hypothetical protein